MPLTVTVRGSRVGNCPPAAVPALATIFPPSARPPIRAASCTPFPVKFRPTLVASDACDPIRTWGANPAAARWAARSRWIPTAQARASSGDSKATKNPSPVATTSSPRFAPNNERKVLSCQDRSEFHASSPIASRRFVDPAMSVNMKVRWTRWVGERPRSCHGSSSATSSRTIACVGQASAASRSFSSSTLAASTTAAFPKSPRCQSNAVGAIVMQLPAPMHLGRSTLARSI